MNFKEANEIPVHFIWIGKPMPKMIVKCLKSLLTVYKDNPIFVWTESSVFETSNHNGYENLVNKDYPADLELSNMLKADNVQVLDVARYEKHRIFNECTFPYQTTKYRKIEPNIRLDIMADAYRLAILEEFGGVYLDADFYHFKSICPKLIEHTAALGQCDQFGHHGNGLIYANQPNHPYIEKVIERVINQSDMVFHRACYIGPNCAYKVRNALENPKEVWSVPYHDYFVLSWEEMEATCYDAHCNNEDPKILYRESMYGVHLWNDLLEVWTQGTGRETMFEFVAIPEESREVLEKKQALRDSIAEQGKELLNMAEVEIRG